jgi:hypothetical protein
MGWKRGRRTGASLALGALLGIAGCATGPAAPPDEAETMTRVVFRNVSPGVEPGSHAALPRTLFRSGLRYGRLEHPPDPSTGTHMLVVVNEPHGFLVDRSRRSALYLRDPGPSYAFRAPIVDDPDAPELLTALEFGKEIAFLRALGATPREARDDQGRAVDRWESDFEGYHIVLLSDRRSGLPREIRVRKGDTPIRAFVYDDYQVFLPLDRSLFVPPPGVQLVLHGSPDAEPQTAATP